jgi:hypothetical protein
LGDAKLMPAYAPGKALNFQCLMGKQKANKQQTNSNETAMKQQ